jgi:glycosyltransferase involved in cell wall biosynthesis
MHSDDAISFYVPARNAAETLPDCVAAVQKQTRPPDEFFLIVDPRSTDNTVAVARSLGVPVIEQSGGTLGATRNEAIMHARHRWLASCDSDVVIQSDWLEKLAATRNIEAAGIGGRTQERICSVCDAWRALHMPHHWGEHPFRNPFMLVSEVLFDRQALLAVGGYRSDLNYYEDSNLCQRLRDAGYDLFYQPAAVATHLRQDDLASLLDLRWKYSEYRQKHLMDHYDGLVTKLDVNREYAINTLSKSLARHREELSYISFLLYFHHAVRDNRSLMSRRPLLSEATRGFLESQLAKTIIEAVARREVTLAEMVAKDLSSALENADESNQPVSPGWSSYLARVRLRIDDFIAEMPRDVREIIASSAGVIRNTVKAEAVQRLEHRHLPANELDQLALNTFVDEAFVQTVVAHWQDEGHIEFLGALTHHEQEVVGRIQPKPGHPTRTAVIAHLESRVNPLRAFTEMAPTIQRLVVCYRPPTSFIPGLDVLSASDLASAAAGAGWTIEKFDTLIGRTRLVLSHGPCR